MVLCNMPPRAGVLSNSTDGAIYTHTALDYYWRYCNYVTARTTYH